MHSPRFVDSSDDYVYPSDVKILSISIYFIFMAICVFIVNITETGYYYNKHGIKISMMFTISLFVIWLVVFQSVKRMLYKILCYTLGIWMLFIIIWSYLAVMSTKDQLGYYCVSRRCPNSFWILTSEINKLPIDNTFDYYNHGPHKMPEEYTSEFEDEQLFANKHFPEMAKNRLRPRMAPYTSRMSWLVKDFTKYLIQTASFLIAFGLFTTAWFYLYQTYHDIKNRSLCPGCFLPTLQRAA